MMHPRILFATDLTARDMSAFRQCCRLALDWDAKLEIVHVKDPAEDTGINPDKAMLKFIPDDFAIMYDHTVLEGSPADRILRFAEEKNAKLIVLGTHGREGADRVFRGSVAEKVLRNSDCPVMTIRGSINTTKLQKLTQILVPIDFSVYGYAAVHFASRLAKTTDASLTICYVDAADHSATKEFPHGKPKWTQDQENLWAQLRKFVPNDPGVTYTHRLLKGEPGKEICYYANTKPYDYIVIGTHGRSGLRRALMGSVAEYVVRHAGQPVITVKPSNKPAKLSAV